MQQTIYKHVGNHMKKPKWQTEFRDLPRIPDAKRWLKGENETFEQKISKKLIVNQSISKEEREIMKGLVLFYGILYKS